MRYFSRTFISFLMIAGLLSGVVLVAPPAAAVSTTTWTTTADFDAGAKDQGTAARNFFAMNGVSQPNNFTGKGTSGKHGGITGDLIIKIHIKPHNKPDPYATY